MAELLRVLEASSSPQKSETHLGLVQVMAPASRGA